MVATLCWSYLGYPGDGFYFDEGADLYSKFTPTGKQVKAKVFSWLAQKGFGPGYFNNSGRYKRYQKTVFKSEAEKTLALQTMFNRQGIEIFETEEAFKIAKEKTAAHAKMQRKLHPY
jgi:hypothetical protein